MNPNFHLETTAEKIEPSLKALQTQYRDIIEKYQPIVDHAHDQLKYIDGILSGFSTIPKSQDTPKSQESPKSFKSLKSPEITESQEQKSVKKVEKVVNTTAPIAKSPRKAPKFVGSAKTLQFVTEYAGETLTSAVERILGDRQGREVGIEEVVSVLYGDISTEQFKVAKDRVTKNLSKGKVTGLWDRIPNKSGYYTAKS